MSYDSENDTIEHIQRVSELIHEDIAALEWESVTHDASKLFEPEKSAFDRLTPRLKELEYDTPEYKASLAELGEALKHHYKYNAHHPEFNENGISGMTLRQLMVMLNDWKAATERMKDGDIRKSLEKNIKRFNIDEQLAQILMNSVEERSW